MPNSCPRDEDGQARRRGGRSAPGGGRRASRRAAQFSFGVPGLRVGDRVRVYHDLVKAWLDADVVEVRKDAKVKVEFEVQAAGCSKPRLCTKVLRPDSDELAPPQNSDAPSSPGSPRSADFGRDSSAERKSSPDERRRRRQVEPSLKNQVLEQCIAQGVSIVKLLGHRDYAQFYEAAQEVFNGLEYASTCSDSAAELLRNPSAEMRETAARALMRMGKHGERHVEEVAALLRDEAPEVRQAAVEALGHMHKTGGSSNGTDVFQLLRDDRSPAVRVAAVMALGALPARREELGATRDVLEALTAALVDEEREVRQAASETLWRRGQGRAYAEQVGRLLRNSDREARNAVAEALWQLQQRRAGGGAPGAPSSPAPPKRLPRSVQMQLQQVQEHGWHRIAWAHGYTLLHWGAERGNMDLCRKVLDLGADTLAKEDQHGKTPVDLARSNGHEEIARFLAGWAS